MTGSASLFSAQHSFARLSCMVICTLEGEKGQALAGNFFEK